jgi:flagellin
MQVNHNIRAMITQHSLYSSNNSMSKSLEKLSTGLRINRAQDDSAGLAMSEQMRTQIRGLGKAKQNAGDGVAALQIAEGGLSEITNIMQRQRELAIQAANDTLTSTERKYLNDEFVELSKEIGRISTSTDYNGKNLLNYNADANLSFGAASVDNTGKPKVDTNNKPIYPGSFTLHVGANYSGMWGTGGKHTGKWSNEIAVTYAGLNCYASEKGEWTVIVGGITFMTKGSVAGAQGSSAAQGISIGTYKAAVDAIDKLGDAIKAVSGARAKIGTFINRLEYTINNIANMEFNTQDAESRIRDTNFATETTQFTRNQIMVQAGTSMLAQANMLPQSVLGLLG